jgi:hypothetical protein
MLSPSTDRFYVRVFASSRGVVGSARRDIALCGLGIFKLPFDATVGEISGATGNPAIPAFANRVAPTDRPDLGYAMIFPSMTILSSKYCLWKSPRHLRADRSARLPRRCGDVSFVWETRDGNRRIQRQALRSRIS